MKKYFSLLLLLVLGVSSQANTITFIELHCTSYNVLSLIDINFDASGIYNTNNVFQVQLSDASGNFSASSTIIGSLGTYIHGVNNVTGIIPPTVAEGSKYRIRIISTNPVVASADNSIDLTVYSAPAPTLSISGDGCLRTDSLVVTGAANAASISWYQNNSLTPEHTNTSSSYQPSALNILDATGVFYAGGYLYAAISDSNPRVEIFIPGTSTGIIVAGGNGWGSNSDQFEYPFDIFVDGNGFIYVADINNQRVQKFFPGGNHTGVGITVAGGNGGGNNLDQLSVDPFNRSSAYGLYVNGDGEVYVADALNDRVLRYPVGSTAGYVVAGGNGSGNNPDQLSYPCKIYLDPAGNLYICDQANARIQKFPPGSTQSSTGVTVAGGNGVGNAANQLNYPYSIFVDANDNLYVLDAGNARIQKFPPNSTSATDGVTLAAGQAGGFINNGGFNNNGVTNSQAMCMDTSGNIYVADSGRVDVFSPLSPATSYLPQTIGAYTANYTAWTGTVSIISNVASVHPSIVPVIAETGNELATTTTGTFVDYQWFVNASPVSNDNTSSLPLVESGIYTVVVTNTYGCIDTSAPYIVSANAQHHVGIANVANGASIKLYPNPNNGQFMLETTNSIGEGFVVYDMTGKAVLQQTITADKQAVDMKGLPAATYTLQIKGNTHNPIRFTVTE